LQLLASQLRALDLVNWAYFQGFINHVFAAGAHQIGAGVPAEAENDEEITSKPGGGRYRSEYGQLLHDISGIPAGAVEQLKCVAD
jgi:hypothetical protein